MNWGIILVVLLAVIFVVIVLDFWKPRVRPTKPRVRRLVQAPISEAARRLEIAQRLLIGTPDIYDCRGYLVRGIRPRVRLAVVKLESILRGFPSDPEALTATIQLGRLYRYGHFDYPGDQEKAQLLYESIWGKSVIPQELAEDAIDFTFGLGQVEVERLRGRPPPEVTPPVAVPRIVDDPQNVHDPEVLRALSKVWVQIDNVPTARAVDGADSTAAVLDDLRREVDARLQNDKKQSAHAVLDAMTIHNSPITFAGGITELDILNATVRRINEREEKKSDLLDILVGRLADSMEHGRVVCAQGRASRVIDTFSGMEDEDLPSLRPANALREELLSKASAQREELLSLLSDTQKTLVDEDDPDETARFADALKEKIRSTARKEYVDSGVTSQENLDQELEQWIDSVV